MMRQLDPKIERIAQLALFASCSLRNLALIAHSGTEVDLVAGRALRLEEAGCASVLVVTEGSVELVVDDDVVGTLGAGGVLAPSRTAAAPGTVVRVGPAGVGVVVFTARELAALSCAVPDLAARLERAPALDLQR